MEGMRTAIRVLMLSRGETQRELATAIGISEQNLSNKLNGRLRFNVEDLRRIFKHYELDGSAVYAIFME